MNIIIILYNTIAQGSTIVRRRQVECHELIIIINIFRDMKQVINDVYNTCLIVLTTYDRKATAATAAAAVVRHRRVECHELIILRYQAGTQVI